MHEVRGPSRGDRLGQQDGEVHAATRFAVAAAGAGVGFLVIAALWVSTCSGVGTAACGPLQRTLLALGSPLILFATGLWAFLRTYRVWREEGSWWGWHGAGWFLLTLMVLTLFMGVPAIAAWS